MKIENKENIVNSVGTDEFLKRYKKAVDENGIKSQQLMNVVNAMINCPKITNDSELLHLSKVMYEIVKEYVETDAFLSTVLNEQCKILGIGDTVNS